MTAVADRPSRKAPLGKFFWLLCALLVLLVMAPMFDDNQWGPSAAGVLSMATLIFALRAIAHERRTFLVGLTLGVAAYGLNGYLLINHDVVLLALPFQFLFYGFVNIVILREILESKTVDADTVCGGICVYLLLGINWAVVFAFIEYASPGSLRETNNFDDGVKSPLDFVYFSFTTLTTLGYGDIVPVGKAARSATIGTAVSGVLFIAVFIGRLVGLTTTSAQSVRANDRE